MKRFIFTVFLVLVTATSLFAASSAVITTEKIYDSDIQVVNISWIAATNGSFVSQVIGASGCLFYAVTDPGTVAPTDNYDITVTNADGIDIAGTQLLSRDTSNSEDVKFSTIRCVNGDVTIAITNNSEDSATGLIRLFFGR